MKMIKTPIVILWAGDDVVRIMIPKLNHRKFTLGVDKIKPETKLKIKNHFTKMNTIPITCEGKISSGSSDTEEPTIEL